MTPRFIVRNEAGKRAVLRVSGVIDGYFDGETFNSTDSERELIRELEMIPDDRGIDLHVNCKGGSVPLSLGIHNALKSVQDRLRVINTGYMLSSATLLPPPKAKVLMTRGSVVMVHKPMLSPDGPMNSDAMRKGIECLDANERAMAEIYSDRTGKSKKAIAELMEGPSGAGTWMTGTEANEYGLGDGDYDEDEEFGPGGDPRGDMTAVKIIAEFKDIPENFKVLISAVGKKSTAPLSRHGGAESAANPPQQTNNQGNQMKKIVHALVSAGFQLPPDASEDQIALTVESLIAERTKLTAENGGLKTSLQTEQDKVAAARKQRIEAHVNTKTWLSPELKAKWVDAIVKDDSAQALLDSMQAPESKPNKAPRGAAPPPPEAKSESGTSEDRLSEIRAQLKTEKDPVKAATLAREARVLRGHSDIVTATAAAPMYVRTDDGRFVQAPINQ